MEKDKFEKIGKEVIQCEINALRNLKSNVGSNFSKVVKLILSCKNGKIIISGVGKSGIIGKKWSATLSSVGVSSFFLDPSNASHGDMGQITSGDIVILISNSGESEELKNIIQYVTRNRNIKLIGITSKKNSILYKNADLSFLMSQAKEAGPENIVPTSSTTTQLALGDAIAIACMKYNNFTAFDFKKVHPVVVRGVLKPILVDLAIKKSYFKYINLKVLTINQYLFFMLLFIRKTLNNSSN